jgi:DNA-binding NarL/FixJ family response regulator
MHQIYPDIPIILCTGFSWKIDESKMKQLGIQAIIHKPALKHEFAHTIRRVLDG